MQNTTPPIMKATNDETIYVKVEADELWSEDRERKIKKETYATYGFHMGWLGLITGGFLSLPGVVLSLLGINGRYYSKRPLIGLSFSLAGMVLWSMIYSYTGFHWHKDLQTSMPEVTTIVAAPVQPKTPPNPLPPPILTPEAELIFKPYPYTPHQDDPTKPQRSHSNP